MNHDTGETNYYAPGSRWTNTPGTTITVSNPGKEVAVQYVYSLIAAN